MIESTFLEAFVIHVLIMGRFVDLLALSELRKEFSVYL